MPLSSFQQPAEPTLLASNIDISVSRLSGVRRTGTRSIRVTSTQQVSLARLWLTAGCNRLLSPPLACLHRFSTSCFSGVSPFWAIMAIILAILAYHMPACARRLGAARLMGAFAWLLALINQSYGSTVTSHELRPVDRHSEIFSLLT